MFSNNPMNLDQILSYSGFIYHSNSNPTFCTFYTIIYQLCQGCCNLIVTMMCDVQAVYILLSWSSAKPGESGLCSTLGVRDGARLRLWE